MGYFCVVKWKETEAGKVGYCPQCDKQQNRSGREGMGI